MSFLVFAPLSVALADQGTTITPNIYYWESSTTVQTYAVTLNNNTGQTVTSWSVSAPSGLTLTSCSAAGCTYTSSQASKTGSTLATGTTTTFNLTATSPTYVNGNWTITYTYLTGTSTRTESLSMPTKCPSPAPAYSSPSPAPSHSPCAVALPYSAQMSDQFIPIYFSLAVLFAFSIIGGCYLIILKPWLRK